MYTYYQGVPNISALIAFKSSVPDVDTVNESKRVSVLNMGGGHFNCSQIIKYKPLRDVLLLFG